MAGRRELYQATFSFGYNGQMLDIGQVVELAGLPNDEIMVKHRYLVALSAKAETWQCQCGAKFAADWQRTAHGDKRHPYTQYDAFEAAEIIRLREDRHHPDIVRPSA